MNSNAYWAERQQVIYDRSERDAERKIASLYSKTAENIAGDIAVLLSKLEGDNFTINDLYRNNQYYALLSRINAKLRQLGQKEITILDSCLLDMYAKTSAAVVNDLGFQVSFGNAAEEVVNKVWCPDGKHWSSRIWTNKAIMEERLEQGLVDCISRGLPKGKVVNEIQALTGNQRYMADRIVRTELTYVQNEAAADSYEKAGITQYEYLAALDDRTADECRAMNGRRFYFKDKKIGENFPPLHANCRCTILPILN